jgi:predicted restriction endonuclease
MLCLIHDKALENGYLYLDDDYSIRLSAEGRRLVGSALSAFFADLDGRKLRRPKQNRLKKEYLKRHRERFGLDRDKKRVAD